MVDTAVFDVDGTLIDSTYQQALAWHRALRRFGVTPAVWRVHRSVGMGGDKLVAAVQAAIDKVGAAGAVMVGDSPYDVEAAGALGLATIAVRTGGFAVDELTEAGAQATYESLIELRDDLDNTGLRGT